MRVKVNDNRDPRWSDDENAAIDQKVEEALAFYPRVKITGLEGGDFSEPERRLLLTSAFREIAKATSVDNVACAPAALLEGFAIVALSRNHDIKTLLAQLVRVFMIVYSEPALTDDAVAALQGVEHLAAKALSIHGIPALLQWKPLPDADASTPHVMH